MKLHKTLCFLFALSALVFCSILSADEPVAATGVGSNVRLPLDYDEAGRIRSQLFAGSASRSEGAVIATDVRVEFYGPLGETEMTMQAGECRYRPEEQKLISSSRVVFERGASRITGEGLEWKGKEKRVTILSNVHMTLSSELEGLKGLAEGQAENEQ
jgi:hypothetical protein